MSTLPFFWFLLILHKDKKNWLSVSTLPVLFVSVSTLPVFWFLLILHKDKKNWLNIGFCVDIAGLALPVFCFLLILHKDNKNLAQCVDIHVRMCVVKKHHFRPGK